MNVKIYCIKGYDCFEYGKIYYSEEVRHWSGGTYVLSFKIYDLDKKLIGEIGYLYSEIFQPLSERRKNIINNLCN